ncbi:unnamed protein product [Closterium sp. Naga37s-1]|nr:unnamed protein product [Closterium sp. Naga37s-1]
MTCPMALQQSMLNTSTPAVLDSGNSSRQFASSFAAPQTQAANPGAFHHGGNLQSLHNVQATGYNIQSMQNALTRGTGMGGVPSAQAQPPSAGNMAAGRFGTSTIPANLQQIAGSAGRLGAPGTLGMAGAGGGMGLSAGAGAGASAGLSRAMNPAGALGMSTVGGARALGSVGLGGSVGAVGVQGPGRPLGTGMISGQGQGQQQQQAQQQQMLALGLQSQGQHHHQQQQVGVGQQQQQQQQQQGQGGQQGLQAGTYQPSGDVMAMINRAGTPAGMLSSNSYLQSQQQQQQQLLQQLKQMGAVNGQLGPSSLLLDQQQEHMQQQGQQGQGQLQGGSLLLQKQGQAQGESKRDGSKGEGEQGEESRQGGQDQEQLGGRGEQREGGGAAFDMSEFPTLNTRPPGSATMASGAGSAAAAVLRKGAPLNALLHQGGPEFSIQNEDFPALPGLKAGADNGGDKDRQGGGKAGEQQGSAPGSRSNTPGLTGPQQQAQPGSGQVGAGKEQGVEGPDKYGLLGLLSVIRMSDPDLTTLALGTDLTTLGLNLNSRENLYRTFASPWADGPTRAEPEFSLPACYIQPTPRLQPGYFSKFQQDTLFYIFYSMPHDEAQLFSADELCNRGWFYHKEHQVWFTRVPNSEPVVKTPTYERGSYYFFDPTVWETGRKAGEKDREECTGSVVKAPTYERGSYYYFDPTVWETGRKDNVVVLQCEMLETRQLCATDNFVLQYEMLEARPQLPIPSCYTLVSSFLNHSCPCPFLPATSSGQLRATVRDARGPSPAAHSSPAIVQLLTSARRAGA